MHHADLGLRRHAGLQLGNQLRPSHQFRHRLTLISLAKNLSKLEQTPQVCRLPTVQPFLNVRTAVLNGTLEDAFRQRYPGFRPANDDRATATAA